MSVARDRGRLFLRAVKILGLLLLLAAILAPIVSSDIRFVLRATFEEARLLLRRRPLEALARDTTVRADRRAKFRMVLSLRMYAMDVLGLRADETYTTFADVGRDTLMLVLSASPRDRLVPYLWRFPIVGAVPYHGYFSLEAARTAAERLERRGYDTYVRPSGAFSTLGWFSDPLLSTVVDGDSLGVVVTVVHEMAHTTLYVPSQTPFNESFATFVGYRGAEAFFRSVGDTARALRAAAIWRDELRLSAFYAWLSASLEAAYAGSTPVDSARDRIFGEARLRLHGALDGALEVYRPDRLAARPLNNASVIAARIYREQLALFESLYQQFGSNVRRTIGKIAAAVDTGDAYERLLELANP